MSRRVSIPWMERIAEDEEEDFEIGCCGCCAMLLRGIRRWWHRRSQRRSNNNVANKAEPRITRHSRRRGRIIRNKITPLSVHMNGDSRPAAYIPKIESPAAAVRQPVHEGAKVASAGVINQSHHGDVRELHKARRERFLPLAKQEEVQHEEAASPKRRETHDEINLPGMVSELDDGNFVERGKKTVTTVVNDLHVVEEQQTTYIEGMKEKEAVVNQLIPSVIGKGVQSTLVVEEDKQGQNGDQSSVVVVDEDVAGPSGLGQDYTEYTFDDDFEENIAGPSGLGQKYNDYQYEDDFEENIAGPSGLGQKYNEYKYEDDFEDGDDEDDEDTKEEDSDSETSDDSSDITDSDSDDEGYETHFDNMISSLIMQNMEEITTNKFLKKTRPHLFHVYT